MLLGCESAITAVVRFSLDREKAVPSVRPNCYNLIFKNMFPLHKVALERTMRAGAIHKCVEGQGPFCGPGPFKPGRTARAHATLHRGRVRELAKMRARALSHPSRDATPSQFDNSLDIGGQRDGE